MREKIINKSGELFLTLGFKSVTMDDIANELGISKKTIYQHFANKTKLVEATTLNMFNNICDGIDCICEASHNPIEELYDIKMFVMNYLKNEKTSPQFQLKKYYPQIHLQLRMKQFEKMHVSVKEVYKKELTQIYLEKILMWILFLECILMVCLVLRMKPFFLQNYLRWSI